MKSRALAKVAIALSEPALRAKKLIRDAPGPFTLVPVLPSTNNRYNQPVYV